MPELRGATREETWALRRDALLREQNRLLAEQNRLLAGRGSEPERRRIEIDPEDADLLLGLCEPGSTLGEAVITEENCRRFVVAQAEAERQRRLKVERAKGGDEPGAPT